MIDKLLINEDSVLYVINDTQVEVQFDDKEFNGLIFKSCDEDDWIKVSPQSDLYEKIKTVAISDYKEWLNVQSI